MRFLNHQKKIVKENSENLVSVLDSTLLAKKKQVSSYKAELKLNFTQLKSSADDLIHQIHIPSDTVAGKILNQLNSGQKINNFEFLPKGFDLNKTIANIKTSSVDFKVRLDDFEHEPKFYYIISGSTIHIKKFNFFTKSFQNLSKDEDSKKCLKRGNFIEYHEKFFLYVGKFCYLGIFSKNGLWHIDLNQNEIYPILICEFPGGEDHTLEYFNSRVYVLGGNSKNILYFMFNHCENPNWNKLECCLVEEIGYSHSTRIGDIIYVVGAKSRYLTKLFLLRECIESEYYELLEESSNKFVFNDKETVIILANKKIIVQGEMRRVLSEDFSQLRSPGKGKILYSYLYFVVYNENFEEQVWRLCLNSFRLDKFKSRS